MKNRKKKKWSDFLWIAELGYLCLGFFNILFAWLGMLFLHPSIHRYLWRQQSILQPLLRTRPAFRPTGRKAEIISECRAA